MTGKLKIEIELNDEQIFSSKVLIELILISIRYMKLQEITPQYHTISLVAKAKCS
jgi:hypothetical protein